MDLQLSRKQYDSLLDSTARFNIWVGSVRSGKTFSSLVRFDDFVRNGPDGDYCLVGKSQQSIKRNIIGPLKNLLGYRFQYSLGKAEATLYNKTIHIIGATDERAEQRIRGLTLAGAYVDEITIIPETFFRMLGTRLSVTGAKFFGTTNPDSPFHWFKKDYIDRCNELDMKVFNFSIEDNPSLDPNFVHSLKKEYRGLWYKRFILGEWVLAEGSIFDYFSEDNLIDYPPGAAEYYIVGVDYGTTNPCAFSLIGYSSMTSPNRWLEKEYYYSSKESLRQKTDTEYAEDMKKFIEGRPVRSIYIDPSAASFKQELYNQGVSGLIDAENEVLDGIRYHSMQLNNGTFKICRNCERSISEYYTYRWDNRAELRGKDKPLKENDHLMDSIRYALYTEWFKKERSRLKEEDIQKMREEAYGLRPNLGGFFSESSW